MRVFILMDKRALQAEEGLWGALVLQATDKAVAWSKCKKEVPVLYYDAGSILFDDRQKEAIINTPIRGEFILVMREVI